MLLSVKKITLSICLLAIGWLPSMVAAEGFQAQKLMPLEYLSPKIRSEPLSKTRYYIDSAPLMPFLTNIVVIDNDSGSLEGLPYILSFPEGRILGGLGDMFFVKGALDDEVSTYSLLDEDESFTHPDTQEPLGTKARVIGTAEVLQRTATPALKITHSSQPIKNSTRLIPRVTLNLPNKIAARSPESSMLGYVLSVENGLWEMGQYSLAIVSLGRRDGLDVGGLLDIMQLGATALDPQSSARARVDLPEEKYGELLIYKAYEKLSVGVIINASRPVVVNDVVRSLAEDS